MRTKQNFFTPPPTSAPHAGFAIRLQRSLLAAKTSVTGAASLEREFNQRYEYQPVARQTTHLWLTGKARPTMDKIEVLGEWLQVSSHWLAHGTDENTAQDLRLVPPGKRSSPMAANYRDRANSDAESLEQIVLKFARLSAKQKVLVEALTDELLLGRQVD